MTSRDYVAAPRAVDVLPGSAARRLTRRDGLLPLVLALELLAGVAFGLAGHAGSSAATAVPAQQSLSAAPVVTVLPSTRPVAKVVTVLASSAPRIGPPVGPLLPGTVRGPAVTAVTAVTADAAPTPTPTPTPTPAPRHVARDPFAALVRTLP